MIMAGEVGFAPVRRSFALNSSGWMGTRQMQEEIRDGGRTGVEAVELHVGPVLAGPIVLDDLVKGLPELSIGVGLFFQRNRAVVLDIPWIHRFSIFEGEGEVEWGGFSKRPFHFVMCFPCFEFQKRSKRSHFFLPSPSLSNCN